MKLAERMGLIAESSTLKMNAAVKELAAKGLKVINLTAGEPDFDVSMAVKNAAKKAIDDNFSRYTPVGGIPDLKRGISEKFKKDNGLEYAPEEIVVTSGAKQAIFNFLLAVVNPGDEVIVPSPYWVSYPEMVKLAGGTPVIVETSQASDFKITPQQLKNAITKKTKALLLNSPSNPTGMVYTANEFKALAAELEDTEIWVASDEIYEKLCFETKFSSFATSSQDAFKRTVTINGFSKTYCMTGWRLGYAAGPKSLISAMTTLQGQSTSNANSIVQKAAVEALKMPEAEIDKMRLVYQKRRDKMAEIFSTSPTFSYLKNTTRPQGAFYFFLNIEATLAKQYNHDQVIGGSEDLAFFLLEFAQVGTVAGKGFGDDRYLRLSYAVSDEEVIAGAKKIVDAVAKLR